MSNRGGQATQSGIHSQNWAAMSLFLQHISRPDFRYIGFEADKLEDFYLVFESDKKIICESKAYKVSFPEFKKIVGNIIKHGQVTQEDEILIICEQADKNLKTLIENFNYYDGKTVEKISKEKKLTSEELKLLPQIRFWEVSQDISRKTAELLISQLLRVWVPTHKIEEIVRDLLEKEVYQGSQRGTTLSREDFIKKLDDKKRLIFEDARYEKDKEKKEQELKQYINDLKNPNSPQWSNNSLSILSDKPDQHYWVLKMLGEEKDLSLKEWDPLWVMSTQGAFSLEVFNIFKKNTSTQENQNYFIKFAPKLIENNSNMFHEEFIKTDIVDICGNIIQSTRQYDSEVFELIQRLFEPSISKYFYAKHTRDNRHEWEQISLLLLNLYKASEDKTLKQKIVDYIFDKFNLVADDGQYWHYTPSTIFTIIQLHFNEDPQEGIIELTKLFSEQLDKFYKKFGKKLAFKGWEHMGSGISQMGNNFSIQDRMFVEAILKPLFRSLYEKNKDNALNIIAECISRKTNNVSREKPDFINRSVLPVLFSEYKEETYGSLAFEILSDFIKMRKGIPWKVDLIFQELRGDYTDEQKWALVKVSLDEYNNLPANVFVEQIVSSLGAKGNKDALSVIAEWVKNPEYNRRQIIGSFSVMDNISKLLDNKDIFDEAVDIYKNYIFADNFITKDNDWETWDVAKVSCKILITNEKVGIEILQNINSSKILTPNQQTLITCAINDIPEDNKELLLKVFQKFLDPLLKDLGYDISKIEERITKRHCREQIVQFADKLAKARCFNEALSVVNVFINDSDPILENYDDDKKGNFNYHKKVIEGDDNPTINTVRGFCAWVLQKFASLYGRDYIPQILPLVKKLSQDPNYYVRVQACVPLLELVKNRNTVLPDNSKVRFVSVETAQAIEDIAFEMLNNKENHKLPSVMQHIAMVFTYMRTIPQEKAYQVLETFLIDEYPKKDNQRKHSTYLADVLSEAAPLYIFFAEYREDAFKDWPKDWAKLGKFNSKPFKDLLTKLVRDGSSEIKAIFAWQFARLPDEVKTTPKFDETIGISARYLEEMSQTYDHETFNNIYRFVEDYVDSHYAICINLWKKCIITESKYFTDNFSKDKFMDMYWWPFFYNGKILLKIAEQEGVEEFLKWFKILVDYPIELLVANDLDIAVEYLTGLKTNKEEIEYLFKRLIERNSKYYTDKQNWLNQNNK